MNSIHLYINMAIIISRVRLRWVKKENRQQFHLHNLFSFGPPSHPVWWGGTTPEHQARNASWQSHLDIVRKCRSSNCIAKLKPLVVKTPQTKEQAEKSERPHGTPFRHFISVMSACAFVFGDFLFSVFTFRRICVSLIYTHMYIYIHRYKWRIPAFMHLSCFL